MKLISRTVAFKISTLLSDLFPHFVCGRPTHYTCCVAKLAGNMVMNFVVILTAVFWESRPRSSMTVQWNKDASRNHPILFIKVIERFKLILSIETTVQCTGLLLCESVVWRRELCLWQVCLYYSRWLKYITYCKDLWLFETDFRILFVSTDVACSSISVRLARSAFHVFLVVTVSRSCGVLDGRQQPSVIGG